MNAICKSQLSVAIDVRGEEAYYLQPRLLERSSFSSQSSEILDKDLYKDHETMYVLLFSSNEYLFMFFCNSLHSLCVYLVCFSCITFVLQIYSSEFFCLRTKMRSNTNLLYWRCYLS